VAVPSAEIESLLPEELTSNLSTEFPMLRLLFGVIEVVLSDMPYVMEVYANQLPRERKIMI
jgi:hypothetical protein